MALNYNLRFPGQYYDRETGKHYNFNRDYNPVTGRYVQSDPIGLNGGVNIFEYVKDNPLIMIDDKGLSGIYPVGRHAKTLQTWIQRVKRSGGEAQSLFNNIYNNLKGYVPPIYIHGENPPFAIGKNAMPYTNVQMNLNRIDLYASLSPAIYIRSKGRCVRVGAMRIIIHELGHALEDSVAQGFKNREKGDATL